MSCLSFLIRHLRETVECDENLQQIFVSFLEIDQTKNGKCIYCITLGLKQSPLRVLYLGYFHPYSLVIKAFCCCFQRIQENPPKVLQQYFHNLFFAAE